MNAVVSFVSLSQRKTEIKCQFWEGPVSSSVQVVIVSGKARWASREVREVHAGHMFMDTASIAHSYLGRESLKDCKTIVPFLCGLITLHWTMLPCGVSKGVSSWFPGVVISVAFDLVSVKWLGGDSD